MFRLRSGFLHRTDPEKLKEFGIKAEIIRLKPYKKNKYKSSKMKE